MAATTNHQNGLRGPRSVTRWLAIVLGLLLTTSVEGVGLEASEAAHALVSMESPASTADRVSVSNPGPAGTDQVLEAVRWMTAAGYELPDGLHIRLRSHDCSHALAVYRDGNVRVCRDWQGRDLQALVIHELAHAWTHARLDAADRRAITAALDLPSWNDRSHTWTQRAGEVVAEAVVADVVPFPYVSRHPQLHADLLDRAVALLAPFRRQSQVDDLQNELRRADFPAVDSPPVV